MARKRRTSSDASQRPAIRQKMSKPSEPESPCCLFFDDDDDDDDGGVLHETLDNGVQLRDGVLSLESIPDHLLEVTQSNAVNSPLLRLPAEIRKKIWQYAISVPGIEVDSSNRGYQYQICPCVVKEEKGIIGHATYLGTPDPSLMSLHKACRQTYFETRTLFYSTNTFYFSCLSRKDTVMDVISKFKSRLCKFPALYNAIQYVKIVGVVHYDYSIGDISFTYEFPALKRLELARLTWEDIMIDMMEQDEWDGRERESFHVYEERILAQIREAEGRRGDKLEIELCAKKSYGRITVPNSY